LTGGPVGLLRGLSRFLLLSGILTIAACGRPAGGDRTAFLSEARPRAIPTIPGLALEGVEPLGRGAPQPERTIVRYNSDDSDLFPGSPTIIEAALYRPPGKGPFPVIVALHDCMGLYGPSGAMNSHMRDWAERLAAQGYAILMPDSFNPRGVPEMCSRDPEIIRPGVERARDVSASLDWVQKQPWAAEDRVALVGWANGGTTALTFATSDGRSRRNARDPELRRPDFRVIVAFYPNCNTMAQAPGWRSDVPLTVFTGSNDDWAPAKTCVALADRISAAGGVLDLVKYYGAGHDFDAPGMPLHVKAGVTTTISGAATIGTDPMARTDSIERLTRLLSAALHPNLP
jgi:dienelactone hydrolase